MSDLLDLFRRNQESDEDDQPAKKKPKRATAGGRAAKTRKKKARTPTASRKSEETVLTLTRRQMLYAASGQVILLGLAFLVGLTFGQGESLKRQTPKVPAKIYIVAQLPLTNGLGNQKPIDIRQIIRRLTTIHDIDGDIVHSRKTRQGYQIAIGIFPSEAAARAFVDTKSLGQFRAAGRLPFQKPTIGPIKP